MYCPERNETPCLSLFPGILTLAIVDLLYGVFVSPFFVENYVHFHWEQGRVETKQNIAIISPPLRKLTDAP